MWIFISSNSNIAQGYRFSLDLTAINELQHSLHTSQNFLCFPALPLLLLASFIFTAIFLFISFFLTFFFSILISCRQFIVQSRKCGSTHDA